MPALNQALSLLASALMNPKQQKPTLDQRFTQLTWEFQNFYNELTNSHIPWTYNSVSVDTLDSQLDYLVPQNVGTVLFAYATPLNNNLYGPIPLTIVDLAHISSNFFLFSPLDFGISRDFNEVLWAPHGTEISFYRDGSSGLLYFRLAPQGIALQNVTLIYATGNWIDGIDPSANPILGQHHMLPIVRAAMSLLPGCEWNDGLDRSKSLSSTLPIQETRYERQFMLTRRSLNADLEPTYRIPFGGDW